MSSLRRSLLRRYRLRSPQLLRNGLLLLALLLLWDGIAAFRTPQIQAALTLNATSNRQTASSPFVAPPLNDAGTTPLASDTFQRPNHLYWGMASSGGSWQGDASKVSYFQIAQDAGMLYAPVQPVTCNAILGPAETNVEVSFSAALSSYGPSRLGAVLRWSDPNNFYIAYLDGQNLVVARAMGGMLTPLQHIPFIAQGGRPYTFRFRAFGSQLSVMVWPTGQPAPMDWQIVTADSALTSGHAGIRIFAQDDAEARVTTFTALHSQDRYKINRVERPDCHVAQQHRKTDTVSNLVFAHRSAESRPAHHLSARSVAFEL